MSGRAGLTRSGQSARIRRSDTVPGLESDLSSDWRHYSELELHPILAAAVEEFRQHGYHGSTVRDIVARVGVTLPSLYYHYGSKQGILMTLLTGSMHDLLVRCRRAVDQAGPRSEDRLSNYVESLALYITNRYNLAFLDFELRGLEDDDRVRYVAQRDELRMMLRTIVADGIAEEVFTTGYPVEASRAVLSMCSAIADWYRPDGPLDAPEVARRYIQLALGLLGYQPR